jgi:hypothetical protein
MPPASVLARYGFVGWVERSDTHKAINRMGIALLNPSYGSSVIL